MGEKVFFGLVAVISVGWIVFEGPGPLAIIFAAGGLGWFGLDAWQRRIERGRGVARRPRRPLGEWLPESIAFFRELAFFAAHASLSVEELGALITRARAAESARPFDPSDPLADLELCAEDESRVWWEDIEADVCAENRVYEATLAEWAAISRGAFQPTRIVEHWESGGGPLTVLFDLEGRHHVLRPKVDDDWIDLEILRDLNRLIAATGIRFEVYVAFDQTAFVVCLRADEKRRLERERDWAFADDV